MPMVRGGHQTLVDYPDGDSKVITLYVEPVEGQIIAHGWEITSVASGGDHDSGGRLDFKITVERPASESSE